MFLKNESSRPLFKPGFGFAEVFMRIRIQNPKKVNPDPIQGDTEEEKLHQKFSNKSFKMTIKKSLKTNKQNIFKYYKRLQIKFKIGFGSS